MTYLLITPCRDEARHARRTLESVVRQSVPPSCWILVDDGSTDGTSEILDDYASRFDFIRIVRRDDRGRRAVGPGVIEAFYTGWESVDPSDYPYMAKFDLDLEIPETYFEEMIRRMNKNPRIGTCSGKPYFEKGGKWISEGCGDDMSVGMIKFYRTECFLDIGGFVREVMWDGIDCHRARMKGWWAGSWDDPEIRFLHLRPMGSSQSGILTGRARHGFGQYFMGTGPVFMLASCFFRLFRAPAFVGSAATFWGYLRSALRGVPRYEDAAFRKYLRRYHRMCLTRGKAKALQILEEEGAAVWERRQPGGVVA